MSVLKYFKNTPRSPPHRATGPMCNFFSSNLQRGPWKKKGGPVAPPTGDRVLSPVGGRQGPLPQSRRMPSFPLSFEPKNSGKKPALAAIPFVI